MPLSEISGIDTNGKDILSSFTGHTTGGIDIIVLRNLSQDDAVFVEQHLSDGEIVTSRLNVGESINIRYADATTVGVDSFLTSLIVLSKTTSGNLKAIVGDNSNYMFIGYKAFVCDLIDCPVFMVDETMVGKIWNISKPSTSSVQTLVSKSDVRNGRKITESYVTPSIFTSYSIAGRGFRFKSITNTEEGQKYSQCSQVSWEFQGLGSSGTIDHTVDCLEIPYKKTYSTSEIDSYNNALKSATDLYNISYGVDNNSIFFLEPTIFLNQKPRLVNFRNISGVVISSSNFTVTDLEFSEEDDALNDLLKTPLLKSTQTSEVKWGYPSFSKSNFLGVSVDIRTKSTAYPYSIAFTAPLLTGITFISDTELCVHFKDRNTYFNYEHLNKLLRFSIEYDSGYNSLYINGAKQPVVRQDSVQAQENFDFFGLDIKYSFTNNVYSAPSDNCLDVGGIIFRKGIVGQTGVDLDLEFAKVWRDYEGMPKLTSRYVTDLDVIDSSLRDALSVPVDEDYFLSPDIFGTGNKNLYFSYYPGDLSWTPGSNSEWNSSLILSNLSKYIYWIKVNGDVYKKSVFGVIWRVEDDRDILKTLANSSNSSNHILIFLDYGEFFRFYNFDWSVLKGNVSVGNDYRIRYEDIFSDFNSFFAFYLYGVLGGTYGLRGVVYRDNMLYLSMYYSSSTSFCGDVKYLYSYTNDDKTYYLTPSYMTLEFYNNWGDMVYGSNLFCFCRGESMPSTSNMCGGRLYGALYGLQSYKGFSIGGGIPFSDVNLLEDNESVCVADSLYTSFDNWTKVRISSSKIPSLFGRDCLRVVSEKYNVSGRYYFDFYRSTNDNFLESENFQSGSSSGGVSIVASPGVYMDKPEFLMFNYTEYRNMADRFSVISIPCSKFSDKVKKMKLKVDNVVKSFEDLYGVLVIRVVSPVNFYFGYRELKNTSSYNKWMDIQGATIGGGGYYYMIFMLKGSFMFYIVERPYTLDVENFWFGSSDLPYVGDYIPCDYYAIESDLKSKGVIT